MYERALHRLLDLPTFNSISKRRGKFLDPDSPVVNDTLWVMSYSVIFGVLLAAMFVAGLIFVPLQLMCKVFSKNVPEYSWTDRLLTRGMLALNLVFIFPLTIVGIWATAEFYFHVSAPINELHDQVFVLKQKYATYYKNADSLLAENPPYDIMPADPVNQMSVLLANRTAKMTDALDFGQTWVIRGAFGGMVPYLVPFFAVTFSIMYIIRGRRLMYTVALLVSLLSLICMMGVAIPNSAWAVLVSSQCASSVHGNMMRYLKYNNPGTCVPDVVGAYVWKDNFSRSECLTAGLDPFTATQVKIDSVVEQRPSGNAAFYLNDAIAAWTVMANTNRTNALYRRVLDEGCYDTANRGAALFLTTLLLSCYLLLHVYILLFSTMRLKQVPNRSEKFEKFDNEKPNDQDVSQFRSNIRERVRRDQFELDNSNVYWTLIGWGIIQALLFLLLAIAFGVGSQKVTVVDKV